MECGKGGCGFFMFVLFLFFIFLSLLLNKVSKWFSLLKYKDLKPFSLVFLK